MRLIRCFLLLATFASLTAACPASDDCILQTQTFCVESDRVTYWADSCGELGAPKEMCACGCDAQRTACEPCACTEGSARCDGQQIELCIGGAWSPDRDCANSAQICIDGRCEDALPCTEGDRRCNGNRAERCQADSWVLAVDCQQSDQLCRDGLCVDPAECYPDQTRCTDGVSEACQNGRWQTVADCEAGGQVCVGGVCLDSCNAGQTRCNGDLIQTCQNGLFMDQTDCAASGLTCVDATCADGCDFGATRCLGEVIQTCQGANWIDGIDCAADGRSCLLGACRGSVAGLFTTSAADIQFDQANVQLRHKRDVDPAEDGCIYTIDLELSAGAGCRLSLVAEGRYVWQAGLALTDVVFEADSACPGFPDAAEGVYEGALGVGLTRADIDPADRRVPGVNASYSELVTTLSLSMAGELTRWDGTALTVGPLSIHVLDAFGSQGAANASCPCQPDCTAKFCGDDSCGGSCGACPGGEICTPLFNCAESYCGDDQITGSEQCDGIYLDDWDCAGLGFSDGLLACDPISCQLEPAGCYHQLDPSSPRSHANYGSAMALEGDRLIVGAEGWGSSLQGAAFVFDRDVDGDWIEADQLDPSYYDGSDDFGISVALSGSVAACGAPGNDLNDVQIYHDTGVAFLFNRLGDGSWDGIGSRFDLDLIASYKRFGEAVALRGTDAAFGMPESYGGIVRGPGKVFRYVGTNNYNQGQILVASDGQDGDGFGSSLAFFADEALLVGAPRADGDAGAVYVFETWLETAVLRAPVGVQGFGKSLAVHNDALVVGASGAAFVYRLGGDGSWALEAELPASAQAPGDYFGTAVALFGDRAAVGAPYAELDALAQVGQIHLYTYDGQTWSETETLQVHPSAANAQFGTSVVLDDTEVIGGATGASLAYGMVYRFER